MQLWVRRVVALVSLFVLATVVAGTAAAQGVTSASITGKVAQEGGQPLEGATIVVTNTTTGQRFQVVTRAGGRFNIENLPPGGPYTVEVRAIGYQAGRRTGVRLELGQRYASDFSLKAAVIEVQELVVTGQQDALINRGRTGSASSISEAAVGGLPSANRNFTDLIVTSPAVVATPNGGPSIGGSNNRFNNIQIDGSANNDLFGLGSSGAPGGQTSGRPIPLGAVKEFQVLVAPFDVRQGGFTGGLVNAVTKSGDNTYRGDIFAYRQNTGLVSEWPHPKPADFSLWQFGGFASGPIVRDKAQFFVTFERQTKSTPYGGVLVNDFDPTNGTAYCDRYVVAIAALGQSAGSCGGYTFTNPNLNLFGKVTAQAGSTGQLELSLNYANSENQTLARSSTADYNLTGGGYSQTNNNLTPRLKWTNIFGGRFNNEAIMAYSRIRDNRPPNTPFPTVIVDAGNYNLVSGAERFSQANSLNQDIWELTDNLSFDVGAHRLTLGTHNEFFGFTNVFFPQSIGQWTFSSIDSLEAGLPQRFDRALPAAVAGIPGGRADGPISDFEVRQFGLYAQDQFTPFKNFNVTLGVRADIPTFPLTPPSNPKFSTAFPELDTGAFPSGNTLWSPRLGFNYDPMGNSDLIVRGGVGVFSGRPPYVWLSNAYGNSGLEQAQLACNGAANVPVFGNFGIDPNNQPTTCRTGAGAGAPTPTINFFDPNFKFPQSLRVNVGVDKRLPWGMVANVDLMYANNFKSLYQMDVNLTGLSGGSGALAGEGGRLIYGTKPATGNNPINAIKRSALFSNVIGHYNRGLDYSYSGIFQLQKRAGMMEFSAGYTRSRSFDMMSQTSSIAFSNYGFATLDGPLNDRHLRTSVFDRPNKVTFSTVTHLPYHVDVGLTYIGVSGSPYGYVINGDANGDGVGSRERNDLVYVPTDSTDITLGSTTVVYTGAALTAKWDSLNTYINGESCLSGSRGKLMERNSCRNPWANFVNLRLSWSTVTYRGQRIELSADVFNVLHLVNKDWGLVKETSSFEGATMLRRTGFDATNDRNRYDLSLPKREIIQTTASRTKLLLGARYTF